MWFMNALEIGSNPVIFKEYGKIYQGEKIHLIWVNSKDSMDIFGRFQKIQLIESILKMDGNTKISA